VGEANVHRFGVSEPSDTELAAGDKASANEIRLQLEN
jgi:hypothetical protein